jgi:hypothetical protein
MIANQINQVDLDIQSITLLSVQEAEVFVAEKDRSCGEDWWLGTPGNFSKFAAFVHKSGAVDAPGNYVDLEYGVRPVLRINNLEANNLGKGDKISVGGLSWTVISEELALCDCLIGKVPFKSGDYHAVGANVYESSDIRTWLNSWALEHSIVTQENVELLSMR